VQQLNGTNLAESCIDFSKGFSYAIDTSLLV